MDITLNGGQEELIERLLNWWKAYQSGNRIMNHPQWFAYSGAAGTGKTTCIEEFINRIGLDDSEYMCCAYVGKAVLNLQRHNLPACTIHSLIYTPIIDQIPLEGMFTADGKQKYKMVFRFILKEKLEENLRLIIVDEATMVNNDLRDKLLSFGLPIVFIGDMNQLPPIFGISEVMMYPDYCLTQIMRQSENDPIVILSQMVLHDEEIPLGKFGLSEVVPDYDITLDSLDEFGMMLCAKNATRDKLNKHIIHDLLRRPDDAPFIGAKVVNRQNDWDHAVDGVSLTNGLIGYITNFTKRASYNGYYKIDFRPDFMTGEFEDLKIDKAYFHMDYAERKNFGISKYNKFEFAYWITTHISQGSEANSVLFLDEHMWDRELTQKLQYTAITRAKERIVIIKNMRKPVNPYIQLYNERFVA